MELLGRETELAAIDRTIDDPRAGGCRAVGLFGEAGIGKSALLGALHERADGAGMLVLEGRAAALSCGQATASARTSSSASGPAASAARHSSSSARFLTPSTTVASSGIDSA
jgi:AAA ATPase domain